MFSSKKEVNDKREEIAVSIEVTQVHEADLIHLSRLIYLIYFVGAGGGS